MEARLDYPKAAPEAVKALCGLEAYLAGSSIDAAPSAELSTRVARWMYWTWFREPLDIISFVCCLLALDWLKLGQRRR